MALTTDASRIPVFKTAKLPVVKATFHIYLWIIASLNFSTRQVLFIGLNNSPKFPEKDMTYNKFHLWMTNVWKKPRLQLRCNEIQDRRKLTYKKQTIQHISANSLLCTDLHKNKFSVETRQCKFRLQNIVYLSKEGWNYKNCKHNSRKLTPNLDSSALSNIHWLEGCIDGKITRGKIAH